MPSAPETAFREPLRSLKGATAPSTRTFKTGRSVEGLARTLEKRLLISIAKSISWLLAWSVTSRSAHPFQEIAFDLMPRVTSDVRGASTGAVQH